VADTPPAVGSHAAAFAAAKRRAAHPELTVFTAGLSFALDAFQRTACSALEDGRGVLVAAPTGAGKTVVGEFAVHLALAAGNKCFYTTPIKALSNQKHADLVARHGAANVGLLTGDTSINGDAPVVVMTTEVLRNMLYAGSPALRGLSHVVMDEVHYLADRFRGAVWEEVILHLPQDVRLVSLSATVSNAEEFGEWIATVRGDTTVVVDEHRPIPLWQHILVGGRLFDLFSERDNSRDKRLVVDPELVRHVQQRTRREDSWQPRHQRRGRGAPPARSGPAGSGSTVDEFICHVASTTVVFEATMHFLGNILIEIDEDQARSEAYAMAMHRRPNERAGRRLRSGSIRRSPCTYATPRDNRRCSARGRGVWPSASMHQARRQRHPPQRGTIAAR